jgi:hypothetical protein
MDGGVIFGAVILFVIGLGIIGIGISFVADIRKGQGPGGELATVESPGDPNKRRRQTYTFLRIESKTVAWIVTILTFLVGVGVIVWGAVVLATG